jgi:hypothetical protein
VERARLCQAQTGIRAFPNLSSTWIQKQLSVEVDMLLKNLAIDKWKIWWQRHKSDCLGSGALMHLSIVQWLFVERFSWGL